MTPSLTSTPPATPAQNLPELEALLPSVMDAFMVAVVGPDGRLALVNEHLARALGTPAAQLQGQALSRLVQDSEDGFDARNVLSFLEHSRCWLGKLMLARSSGAGLLVQVTLLPLKDTARNGGGTTTAPTVLMLATSASRRLDFPMLTGNYQDHFFALLEGLGTAIILHREGRIIYANESALRLTGHTQSALVAMPHDHIAHPNHRTLMHERIAARLRGDTVHTRFEVCLLTAQGDKRWVEQTVGLVQIDGKATLIDTFVDQTAHRLASATQAHMRKVLAQIIDGNPVPTFVIDATHTVTHWNRACELISGLAAAGVVGTRLQWKAFYASERPVLADLIVSGALDGEIDTYYPNKFRPSTIVPGAFEAEDFFPHLGGSGRWVHFTAAPLRDGQGKLIGAIETLVDVSERRKAEQELLDAQAGLEQLVLVRTSQLASVNAQLAIDVDQRRQAEAELRHRNQDLELLNHQLSQAQGQLAQSEKLASIGQLAAGVAHEINNPIGYVHSNIGTLQTYLKDLFALLSAYEARTANDPANEPAIAALRQQIDIDFLREDVPSLISESQEGISRVKKIVQDLKDFSRVDSTQEWQAANLHQGIDSTLNIVNNEIKYSADVVKAYGELPLVDCLPSQLNQVFMNLLVNAAHAMGQERGTITISTGVQGEQVWLEFADTGSGIPKELQSRIFDPFFTTKPVGKGTGLGLSLTYGIVQKHHGHISVRSEPGQGTVFRIELPLHQHGSPEPLETSHG